MNEDLKYLKMAYREAKKAYLEGEVPVGCVITMDGKVIAKSHNMREQKHLVLAHAEMEAIRKACKKTGTKFLDGATIYITLEPCIMCLGAIIQARISRVCYSAKEPKHGAIESICHVLDDYKFNTKVSYDSGLMADDVEKMMKDFFIDLRNKK